MDQLRLTGGAAPLFLFNGRAIVALRQIESDGAAGDDGFAECIDDDEIGETLDARRLDRLAVQDTVCEMDELRPKLVAGDADNIKITLPEDLPRAERILKSRSAT